MPNPGAGKNATPSGDKYWLGLTALLGAGEACRPVRLIGACWLKYRADSFENIKSELK